MDRLVGHHIHFNLQLTGWLTYVSIPNGPASGPPSPLQSSTDWPAVYVSISNGPASGPPSLLQSPTDWLAKICFNHQWTGQWATISISIPNGQAGMTLSPFQLIMDQPVGHLLSLFQSRVFIWFASNSPLTECLFTSTNYYFQDEIVVLHGLRNHFLPHMQIIYIVHIWVESISYSIYWDVQCGWQFSQWLWSVIHQIPEFTHLKQGMHSEIDTLHHINSKPFSISAIIPS